LSRLRVQSCLINHLNILVLELGCALEETHMKIRRIVGYCCTRSQEDPRVLQCYCSDWWMCRDLAKERRRQKNVISRMALGYNEETDWKRIQLQQGPSDSGPDTGSARTTGLLVVHVERLRTTYPATQFEGEELHPGGHSMYQRGWRCECCTVRGRFLMRPQLFVETGCKHKDSIWSHDAVG